MKTVFQRLHQKGSFSVWEGRGGIWSPERLKESVAFNCPTFTLAPVTLLWVPRKTKCQPSSRGSSRKVASMSMNLGEVSGSCYGWVSETELICCLCSTSSILSPVPLLRWPINFQWQLSFRTSSRKVASFSVKVGEVSGPWYGHKSIERVWRNLSHSSFPCISTIL